MRDLKMGNLPSCTGLYKMLTHPCPAMSFTLSIPTFWTTPEMPSALTSTTELDAEGGEVGTHRTIKHKCSSSWKTCRSLNLIR